MNEPRFITEAIVDFAHGVGPDTLDDYAARPAKAKPARRDRLRAWRARCSSGGGHLRFDPTSSAAMLARRWSAGQASA